MYFRFENLEVWKDSREFVNKMYAVTKTFPKEEQFGLISQLRRAALSVMLNITEGADRRSDADFKRFLRMSITSAQEVVSGMYIALDQKIVDKASFDAVYERANKLVSRVNSLIKKL